MNFEQILIRLGVDGTAVKTGLGKVSAYAKAWGLGLVNDLKGTLGRVFAVGAAVEGLNKIRERILEISNISRETGANTNFVQSMMQAVEKTGQSFDKASMGMARFNHELGAAKMGDATALKKLADIGVITEKTDLKTLTFAQGIHNLAVRFDELGDKQKQAYLLNQAFGRSYDTFQPIFNQGAGAVDRMSSANPFTKIDTTAISDYAKIWSGIKSSSFVVMATVTNAIDYQLRGMVKNSYEAIRSVTGLTRFTDSYDEAEKKRIDKEQAITNETMLQAAAEKQGIEISELKAKILEEQRALLQKQAELKGDIDDRDKESVREMAEQARKFSGVKSPLELMRTVTPRMRTALKIDTLEERSKIAFLKGDDAKSTRLQSEADQIRKANPWLKRMDVDPMLKTNNELEIVNRQLEPVKRMAELVNNSSK